ncbi:GNAT family N-acetyltransferase [Methylobacterium terricola]|uniref:GNAT family N-acetyltransferase n=1 Tax=Methylobacterium terricola TaxID=2583531 RepID=A0A5C4LJH1_9HYPH|nr:GNAT family N-acetyltransferase [Methylobacterium terricola]TNC13628.1 GNAT family N-acetyltransferase [Methylobacterium terricola]
MAKAANIGVETSLQDDVTGLLAEAAAVAARLYPGEPRRPITPGSLAAPGIHVLVARGDGAALGLCAIIERGDGEVELKRLIVTADARGRGVGSALVRGAEALARRLGARAIVLEVGIENRAAQALYRRAGFTPRGPFPPYRDLPVSLFLERPVPA